jgi:hypothetical protein
MLQLPSKGESGLRIAMMIMLAAAAGVAVGNAQKREHVRVVGKITYVSTGAFYMDAGRAKLVAAGDTAVVLKGSAGVVIGVVGAVSSSSSVVSIVRGVAALAVGDSAIVEKDVDVVEPTPAGTSGRTTSSRASGRPETNDINGRFALDFSQPAAILRLDIARVFGSAVTFSFYGRTYADASSRFSQYGTGSRVKMRLYELSISLDNARLPYAWSLGRVTSRYVGGLGGFDGGQFLIRQGNFTFGALAGAQADYSTSAVDLAQTKLSAFVNYGWGGSSAFRTSDITIAYGQQRFKGKLDRAFLYAQSSIRLGTELFLYSSSEFDFKKIENGVISKSFRMTNSFATLTYMPSDWLTLNAGYDATRTIYLFESMKTIADTLLDKTLKEGFRTSFQVRLPYNVLVGAQGNWRIASGVTSNARTLTTNLRVGDVLNSGFNVGAQYSSIVGLYTQGNDVIVDLDRWIAEMVALSVHYDHYGYTIKGQDGRLLTRTLGGSVNCRLSRQLYAVATYDQIWDTIRSNQRMFLEIGWHF